MRSISISLVFLSLLFSSASFSATYKWTDEDGNVVYSQHPPKTGTYERMTGLQKSKSSGASDDDKFEKEQAQKKAELEEDLKKQEQQLIIRTEEVEQRNCEQARKNLDVYTRNKRFLGEDGKVFRMDDDERQKKIQEAEDAIKEYCKE